MKHLKQRAAGIKQEFSVFVFFFLFFVLCNIFCVPSSLASTTIESGTLEYDAKTSTYTATGKVNIQRGLTTIEADEVIYNEKTSDVSAKGNVKYNDPDVTIKAARAEINLDAKTGRLYEAEIFSKKDNYHISGSVVEKKSEKEYTLDRASFTTCDAPIPAWCFKGKEVDAIVGDRLKARNVTLDIKGKPVLYTPYFKTSLSNERESGLLTPDIGYVKTKGIHYEQPLFWAISENRDVTIVLDAYSKRGIGEGLEYRYIETNGSMGNLWLYHLKDNQLDKDFWDARGFIKAGDSAEKSSGYLNLSYLNSRDFYSEYNPYIISKERAFIDSQSYLNNTTMRFLESTGEVSVRLDSSRFYLTSQYLIDLKEGADTSAISQRLPEIGYFMNPVKIGPLVFSLSSSLSNFFRQGSIFGQRFDIYPRITHSFGTDVFVTESLGLRETAYSLRNADVSDISPHRESFDYSITANTRMIKRYSSFTHILEPSLGYTFIPSTKIDLPLFDSTELYTKTSRIDLSLMNRFIDKNGEFLTLRITQPFDSYNGDRPFMPLKIEAAIQRPIGLRGEVSYNVHTGRIEDVNSDIGLRLYNAFFSIGERYNRIENIAFYSIGTSYNFSKSLSSELYFWYDAKNGGIKDVITKVIYKEQCWGVTMAVTKRQNDYSVSVLFDLLGLGTIKF